MSTAFHLGPGARQQTACRDMSWLGRADCQHCPIFNEVLFSALTPEDLETVLEPVDQFNCAPGSVIYHEGMEEPWIYTVRDGLVKLVRYLPDGTPRILRLLTRGDNLGLEHLLGDAYHHSAIAIQATSLCRIPVSLLHRLDADRPRLYRALMQRWSRSLRQVDDRILALSSGTVRRRVAHLIEWLGEITVRDDPCRLHLLSGEDMAALVGVRAESISRTIAELKRLGVLEHLRGDHYRYAPGALAAYVPDE